ncbi:hypothetical protein GCM10028803_00370 [Larkinella knui]|uniref:Uncharacterized protein n=1 Tax=Larkinella knui TaxID=2025310 RepID=A0A3P1CJD6_9BACT|nr:hypothetical protein [Larkinella knui]RRB13443.1 hypothetical protein EHT87_14295 [Larkinella knui]
MAQEQGDEILVEVKLDEAATEKRIVDLRQKLEELRSEKDRVKKEFKEGGISAEQYAKSLTRITRESGAVTKEINSNHRALAQTDKANQTAVGSVDQLRAAISVQTAQWNALSREERNNAQIGGVLQKSIKDMTDEVKEASGSVGNFRDNVGDYAGGIERAITGNDSFFSSIRGGVGQLKSAASGALDYAKGLKLSIEGAKGAEKASLAFGLSLKAMGIGLIITLISGLITYLTKFDDGMDKVEQATAAFSAALDELFAGISKVGGAVFDIIDDFGEKGFLGAIKNIPDRLDQMKHSLDGVTTNMVNAGKAAVEYTKTMQDLEDQRDGMISQEAQVAKLVDLATLATKDQSKTLRERLALLDTAGAAEKKLAEQRLTIERNELAALLKRKAANTANQDADRKEIEEKKAAVINAERETLATLQTVQNRRSALLKQEQERAEQNVNKQKELRKGALEFAEKEAEAELQIARLSGKDRVALAEKVIQTKLAVELFGLKKGSAQYKAAQLAADVDLAETRLHYLALDNAKIITVHQNLNARLLKEDEKLTKAAKVELTKRSSELQEIADRGNLALIDSRIATAKKGSKAELEARIAGIKESARQEIAQKKLTAAEAKAIEDKANREIANQREAFAMTTFEGIVAGAQIAASTLTTIFEGQNQLALQMLEQREKAALKSAGANAELRGKLEEGFQKKRDQLEEKANKKKKAIARAEAAINTAVAATKAYTAGPIIGPVLAGLIILQGLAQQAFISSQKFAQGGYVSDKKGAFITGPGTGTSDSIPALISDGESVLTAKATRENYNELSAMNVKGGGRPFPGASNSTGVPRFNYGGVLQNDSATLEAVFTRVIARMPAPVVAVTDIHSRSAEVRRVEVRSKL